VSFELIPQKLVYGGHALGHHQGWTVLVPRALPGERLEVEPVRTAKGVVHARPLRVLEASPERIDPLCPYFGRCGGCQYQHMRPEYQAAAKREILRETLRRIGKITWDSEIRLHAAQPWNYRNQAQLKVAPQPHGPGALGFFEAESHHLFPVDVCLILSPGLNALLAQLRDAEGSTCLARCREIELLADHRDERVAITVRRSPGSTKSEAKTCDLLSRLRGVVSVALESNGKLEVFGQPSLEYAVGDFRYRVSPGSFFQSSRFLLHELVAAVTRVQPDEAVALASENETLALDLFAGVGLFTLPLARRFARVVGVEASAISAADLAANARAHSLSNVRAVSATAYDFLRRFAQAEPELVVLDPPRAGVGAGTLKLLVACRPQHIHYVSCSPPTLARDLSYLSARGYRLKSIELFDLFPQTFHIEALARLTRYDGPGP
jgi:23S rRNA (uracil1939-C5)-methyltransferase